MKYATERSSNKSRWTTNPKHWQQTQKMNYAIKRSNSKPKIGTSNQTQTQTSSQFSKPDSIQLSISAS